MGRKIEHKIIDGIECKYCYVCKEYKDINLFTKNKNNWDGLGSECTNCRKEKQKQWYDKNRNKLKEYAKEYYQKNKEILDKKKKDYLDKGDNRKRHNLSARKSYYKNYNTNREYLNIKKQERRSLKKLLPSNLTLKDWQECKRFFSINDVFCCAYCGKEIKKPTQDHIIPITNGGGYIKGNIIPACKSCNSKKWGHHLEEWYEQQDFFDQEKLEKIYEWVEINKDEDKYALPLIKFKDYKNSNCDIKELYNSYITTYKKVRKYNDKFRHILNLNEDNYNNEYKKMCLSIEKDLLDILINLEEYLPIENKYKTYKLLEKKNNIYKQDNYYNIDNDITDKVLKDELYDLFKKVLTKKQYISFYLYYVEGYNQEQIGKILNVHHQTVGYSLRLGMKNILNSKYLNKIKKYLLELVN